MREGGGREMIYGSWNGRGRKGEDEKKRWRKREGREGKGGERDGEVLQIPVSSSITFIAEFKFKRALLAGVQGKSVVDCVGAGGES